jgi:hypothetical protein
MIAKPEWLAEPVPRLIPEGYHPKAEPECLFSVFMPIGNYVAEARRYLDHVEMWAWGLHGSASPQCYLKMRMAIEPGIYQGNPFIPFVAFFLELQKWIEPGNYGHTLDALKEVMQKSSNQL